MGFKVESDPNWEIAEKVTAVAGPTLDGKNRHNLLFFNNKTGGSDGTQRCHAKALIDK